MKLYLNKKIVHKILHKIVSLIISKSFSIMLFTIIYYLFIVDVINEDKLNLPLINAYNIFNLNFNTHISLTIFSILLILVVFFLTHITIKYLITNYKLNKYLFITQKWILNRFN